MILDRDTLRQLSDELMGFERLEELEQFLEECIHDMTELVARAEDARRAGDAKGLRMAAHTLKSSAGLLGGVALNQRALQIERATGDEASALVGELRSHLDDLRAALARQLETWRRSGDGDHGK